MLGLDRGVHLMPGFLTLTLEDSGSVGEGSFHSMSWAGAAEATIKRGSQEAPSDSSRVRPERAQSCLE